MGFTEFGQSLLGMIVFITAMLLVFGGFTNQDLFTGYLPNGITNPNDVNVSNGSVSVSNAGTAFATTTGSNPTQDNNPWLNLIFNDFGNAFNLFSKMISGLFDTLAYMGLPGEIIYVLLVPLSIFSAIFLIYFVSSIAIGLFRGG